MRVPAISRVRLRNTTMRNSRQNNAPNKLSDPPSATAPQKSSCLNFCATITKYIKKYATLPEEIKEVLSPRDAVDMFQDMEFIANGVVKRRAIGQGGASKVYENPWLDNYSLIILNNPNDADLASQTVYAKIPMGKAVWKDASDPRVQLIVSA